MIFIVEGLVTIFISVLGYLFLPDRPEKARWLNSREKALCAFRIKSETPDIIQYIEKTKWKIAKHGILSFNAWFIGGFFGLTASLVQGFSVFFLLL